MERRCRKLRRAAKACIALPTTPFGSREWNMQMRFFECEGKLAANKSPPVAAAVQALVECHKSVMGCGVYRPRGEGAKTTDDCAYQRSAMLAVLASEVQR